MAAKKPKSKAQSSRTPRHGGHRHGAGRKTNEANKLRAELNAQADEQLAPNLPRLLDNMLVLANGGYERVEEKWEPVPGDDSANPRMMLIERKVSVADRDRAANQYLIDRLLGKPIDRHEFRDVSDEELIRQAAGIAR